MELARAGPPSEAHVSIAENVTLLSNVSDTDDDSIGASEQEEDPSLLEQSSVLDVSQMLQDDIETADDVVRIRSWSQKMNKVHSDMTYWTVGLAGNVLSIKDLVAGMEGVSLHVTLTRRLAAVLDGGHVASSVWLVGDQTGSVEAVIKCAGFDGITGSHALLSTCSARKTRSGLTVFCSHAVLRLGTDEELSAVTSVNRTYEH